MCEITGMVFGIQHFSIHDGNGIRTNVFLSGCPLHCIWCHNPEGMLNKPILSFAASRCSGCGVCFELYPQCHKMENGEHVINRSDCQHCFCCVKVCQGLALEQVGSVMTVSEVVDDVLKDKRFYETSEGGVTLSGGEPMSQAEFSLAILKACKKEGINTVLETCGLAETVLFEKIEPFVDTFLFDIKESDPDLFAKNIGSGYDLILKNLDILYNLGSKIVLRCPVIPGINDRTAHFEYLAGLSKKYPRIEGIEIMPYHKLGVSKAERMGTPVRKSFDVPSRDTVNTWNEIIKGFGGKISIH